MVRGAWFWEQEVTPPDLLWLRSFSSLLHLALRFENHTCQSKRLVHHHHEAALDRLRSSEGTFLPVSWLLVNQSCLPVSPSQRRLGNVSVRTLGKILTNVKSTVPVLIRADRPTGAGWLVLTCSSFAAVRSCEKSPKKNKKSKWIRNDNWWIIRVFLTHDHPAHLDLADHQRHHYLSHHETHKPSKMRCILTTIFEIFICCTLYKLFTIMEHAESSRGRTQVEMLASFSQQYSKEKEQDTFTFIP